MRGIRRSPSTATSQKESPDRNPTTQNRIRSFHRPQHSAMQTEMARAVCRLLKAFDQLFTINAFPGSREALPGRQSSPSLKIEDYWRAAAQSRSFREPAEKLPVGPEQATRVELARNKAQSFIGGGHVSPWMRIGERRVLMFPQGELLWFVSGGLTDLRAQQYLTSTRA